MSKQCCYCQRRVSQRWLTSKQREFDHFEISQKIFLSFKKELTHFINNTCFWLWSIKKRQRYETYNVKINVAEYNVWYMKRIGKYEYAFVDGKINWCTE